MKLKNTGLFLHWGVNTGNENWEKQIPLYKSNAEFEEEATKNGWNAKKWVDAARKLHATYISLACFHGALGYLKLWKSDIPGTYTSKRDFLGELIEEADKYGIKILLYITPEPKNYAYFKDDHWINPDEYRKYKNNPEIDILDQQTWQTVYCIEIVDELIKNYPKLAGFWFDGWSNKVNSENLFNFIHEKNKDLIVVRNDFSREKFDGEDYVSVEQFGKVNANSFDLATGCWQEGLSGEYCYTMLDAISDWWYCKEYPEFEGTELLKRYISLAASEWTPKIGIGPTVSGDFPKTTQKFIDMVGDYLDWAADSLFDTLPGDLPQCEMNDGAYIINTKRNNEHFIHIMMAPKTNKLIIPDAGYTFKNAVNFKTGEAVDFSQEDGMICFNGDFSACDTDGDFVIKLTAEERRIIKETECEDKELPCEIKINVGKNAKSVLLEQRNNSSETIGGWGSVDNNRLKDIEVYSDDELIFSGTLSGARGNKQINITKSCDELRIVCKNAYDTNNGSVFLCKQNNERLDYDDVYDFMKVNGTEYVITNDSKLYSHKDNDKKLIADDAKKLILAADNTLYYISCKKELKTLDGVSLDIIADDVAITMDNDIYYLCGDVLKSGDTVIDTGVNCICAYGKYIEYCKGNEVIRVFEDDKRVIELDYDFIGITEHNFLFKNGDAMFRNVNGKEDCVFGTNVKRIVECDGEKFIVKGKRAGNMNLKSIKVF